jgi:PAS domain S-box-containing protein
MAGVLERAGMEAVLMTDFGRFCDELLSADAAIVTEEMLTDTNCNALKQALSTQSLWSDMPLIVLGTPQSYSGIGLFEKLSPNANLTLVERPVRPFTLVTVAKAAIRARRRQYLMRDHMAEMAAARGEIGRQRDQLFETRTRLEAALGSAETGVFTWDAESDTVMSDRTLAGIFGLNPARRELPLADYVERAHPDDRAKITSEIERALAGRETVEADYRVVHPDGTVRWVLARGRLRRDSDGKPLSITGVVVDVTDRVESDRARRRLSLEIERHARIFDAILSSMTDMVFIFDPDCRVVYANRALLEFWGLRLDQVTGKTMADLNYPNSMVEKIRGQVERTIQTGEHLRAEVTDSGVDGVARQLEYIMVPIRGTDGTVELVAGVSRDISQRKLLEERQAALLDAERTARAEAERIGRLKDEFLSTLSHELRTPLNAISGWVQLLSRGTLNEQDRARAVETIGRNTQSQKELIEDLLDMSRIVSGKTRLEIEPVDLDELIRNAVETSRPAAEAKGISLIAEACSEAGTLYADATRLRQVLWNLLSNAVKFTPPGGEIRVESRREGDEVRIRVTDSGVGIAPEFLPQIFDRFRQADASSTRRHGGLGLGLSIVKQLVEMHGGRVEAASAGEGAGSTFTITLPASLRLTAEPPAPRPSHRKPSCDAYRPGALDGVRVLIVDDDRDGREVIQRILEESGARVVAAGSVDEAERRLAEHTVDVLVSDIGMPRRDGYELIAGLRSSGNARLRGIPAAALTAFARSEDRATALAAGYDAHVTKPVDPGELLGVIDRLRKSGHR